MALFALYVKVRLILPEMQAIEEYIEEALVSPTNNPFRWRIFLSGEKKMAVFY